MLIVRQQPHEDRQKAVLHRYHAVLADNAQIANVAVVLEDAHAPVIPPLGIEPQPVDPPTMWPARHVEKPLALQVGVEWVQEQAQRMLGPLLRAPMGCVRARSLVPN